MRWIVAAVGTRMPQWADAACAEYVKRMSREIPLSICAVKAEPRDTGKSVEQIRTIEAQRLHAAVSGADLVALDERGRDVDTMELSRLLQSWMTQARDVAFLIGGADGLAEDLKARASSRLRLSSMTLPHALARVLLCEQIYRATSILRNHPYHRE